MGNVGLPDGGVCGGDGVQPARLGGGMGLLRAGAPEHWASLSDEYATCANGRQQSPIDIAGYDNSDSTAISFDYSGEIQSINDDGRFVHVGFGPANTLSVGQRTYDLKSAHFHSPSEHLIGDESRSRPEDESIPSICFDTRLRRLLVLGNF